jgi:tRNA 2-thiouridine synthesizing protein E
MRGFVSLRIHRDELTGEDKVPTFEVEGRVYDVDEDGFLQEPDLWSEAVARDFAHTEDVQELTDGHWKVIRYIRDYYLQFGIAPMVRKVCKETGYKLSEIYELFPSGPAKGACKLAGLPKPTGCV